VRIDRRLLLVTTACAALIAEPCAAWSFRSKLRHLFPKSCARYTWVQFDDVTEKPLPTAEQQADGFIVFQRSVLDRVYQHSNPRASEIVSAVTLAAALDEYEPIQLGVFPLRDLTQMRVSVSDLYDDAHHVIPASEIDVRMVRYYGARLSDRVKNHSGIVPKTLEPAVPIDIDDGSVRPYWITVHVPKAQPGGRYTGTITVTHGGGARRLPLSVEVIGVPLEEPPVLYGTLCVGTLANLWKWLPSGQSERASQVAPNALIRIEETSRHAALIFRDQREHGMTSMSLRSGAVYEEKDGHPYLPDLEVAMELYRRSGFTQPLLYCLGHLLKTNKINRSANYREFDPAVHVPMARTIAAYYTQRFRDAGLPGIVFIPVEEPNRGDGIGWRDPPEIRQTLAHDLTQAIRESGGATALTCTPESVASAIESLDYWIVAYRRFTPSLYERAQRAHAQLCLYANATMTGQGTYFTRFLFGYFTWANGLKGLLPWTYPLQPKLFPQNLGNRGEGALNVREGFLGLDGKPVPTIQWELAREGIDDAKYLVTIQALVSRARATGSSPARRLADEADVFLTDIRRAVNPDVRHYTFENVDTLEPIPQDGWDAQKFEQTRQQALAWLQRLSSALEADSH